MGAEYVCPIYRLHIFAWGMGGRIGGGEVVAVGGVFVDPGVGLVGLGGGGVGSDVGVSVGAGGGGGGVGGGGSGRVG